MTDRFQILSLDGGGIRGVFSAALLTHFEEHLNINITDHFDLIVGTSTGGIIALGLGLGMRPKEILEFYTSNGNNIFPSLLPPWVRRLPFAKYFDPLDWHSVLRRKYSTEPLKNALQIAFQGKSLGHSSKRLAICAYNIDVEQVKLFKTAHHPRFMTDYKVPAWQTALATSAAPTYFSAFQRNGRNLIDGGVWANDPIMVGLTEALGVLNQPQDSIRILSIGTLDEISGPRPWLNWGGKALWAKPAPDLLISAQSSASQGQAKLIIGQDALLRINPPVPQGRFAMDDPSAINTLLGMAEHHAEHALPAVKAKFLTHVAPDFSPYYEVTDHARD